MLVFLRRFWVFYELHDFHRIELDKITGDQTKIDAIPDPVDGVSGGIPVNVAVVDLLDPVFQQHV